jgi:hypothetical protein
MVTTDRILALSAAAEAATGLALILVPSVVSRLLLGHDLTGEAILVARVAGLALIGLGLACWPGPPAAGMLVYGLGVALYLAYVGATGEATGPLLWPVVALHVGLAVLIAAELRKPRRDHVTD